MTALQKRLKCLSSSKGAQILASPDFSISGLQQHDVIINTCKGVDEQLIIIAPF